MNPTIYPFVWSNELKVSTIIVLLVLLVVAVMMIGYYIIEYTQRKEGSTPLIGWSAHLLKYKSIPTKRFPVLQRIVIILMAVFVVGALVSTIVFTPRYVSVSEESIDIQTVAYKLTIPASTIDSIGTYPAGATTRAFGSGGCCGYIGWFRHPQLGTFIAMYTNPQTRTVIYRHEQKPIVISDCPLEELRATYNR